MIPHEERVRYISRSGLMSVEGCEKCWVADKIITGPSRLRRFFSPCMNMTVARNQLSVEAHAARSKYSKSAARSHP